MDKTIGDVLEAITEKVEADDDLLVNEGTSRAKECTRTPSTDQYSAKNSPQIGVVGHSLYRPPELAAVDKKKGQNFVEMRNELMKRKRQEM